jgi:hypothetical protein
MKKTGKVPGGEPGELILLYDQALSSEYFGAES